MLIPLIILTIGFTIILSIYYLVKTNDNKNNNKTILIIIIIILLIIIALLIYDNNIFFKLTTIITKNNINELINNTRLNENEKIKLLLYGKNAYGKTLFEFLNLNKIN